MSRTVVGVLALQGDVARHLAVLQACGVVTATVRRPSELASVDGLVIPGGESTTIDKLASITGLAEPLRAAIRTGLPVFGSCAGMIMLADRVLDGPADQRTFGGLNITVRRNAFGRQIDSFESDLTLAGIEGGPVHAVFIRAPWVESVGPDVTVLASVPGPDGVARHPVAVRQGPLLATSFHPELTDDHRLHADFIRRCLG